MARASESSDPKLFIAIAVIVGIAIYWVVQSKKTELPDTHSRDANGMIVDGPTTE